MAFVIDNFSTIGSNARKGEAPQHFSYKTNNDSIATVIAPNYFKEVAFQLSGDDIISVLASDGMAFLHVVMSDPVQGTVAIDIHIISNQGGSDNSQAFHNVYALNDFPTPVNNVSTLQNGVNYLIYMESPVSSDITFLIPDNYDKGGSMIYMGGCGVLQWLHTNGQAAVAWLTREPVVSVEDQNDVFTLSRFVVEDADGESKGAIKMTGQSGSNPIKGLTVRDCRFEDFEIAIDVDKVQNVMLREVVVDNATTTPAAEVLRVMNVVEFDCRGGDIIQRNQTHAALAINPIQGINDPSHSHIEGTDFGLAAANDIGAIVLGESSDTSVFNIAGSLARDISDGTPKKGFAVEKSGSIKSIENGATGQLKITTFNPHGLSTGNIIKIFGTLNYDDRTNTVLAAPAPTSTTFEVAGTFSAINYAGFFLKGSASPHSDPKVVSTSLFGFDSPPPVGVAAVPTLASGQPSTVVDEYKKFVCAAGELGVEKSGLAKDFIVSDYLNVELKYVGSSAMIGGRVTIVIGVKAEGTVKAYGLKFRVSDNVNKESHVFPFTRNTTVGENSVVTFSANMTIENGDTIEPLWTQTTAGAETFTVTSINFMVEG